MSVLMGFSGRHAELEICEILRDVTVFRYERSARGELGANGMSVIYVTLHV